MLLIYDGKCAFCRGLAYKIQLHAGDRIEVLALGDPEAVKVLRRFYPDGPEHDFYVVDGDRCRRGTRVLPGLLQRLGVRNTAGILAEYAAFTRSSRACEAAHVAGDGHEHEGTSRRTMLKYAALAPVVAAMARLPQLRSPFEGAAPDDLQIRFALVLPGASGSLRAYVRRVEPLATTRPNGTAPAGKRETRSLDNTVISDTTVPELASAGGDAYLRLWRTENETTYEDDGATRTERLLVRSALLDHARYNVGLNVGVGPVDTNAGRIEATTIVSQVTPDLARPYVDVVYYRHRAGDSVARYVEAFRLGLRELALAHRHDGSADLAELYGQVDAGLALAGATLAGEVAATPPVANGLLVATSMPEAMRYVPENLLQPAWALVLDLFPEGETPGVSDDPVPPLQLQAAGGACGCGCAICSRCCGCGCSLRCGSQRCGCWCCGSTGSCGCGCCTGC